MNTNMIIFFLAQFKSCRYTFISDRFSSCFTLCIFDIRFNFWVAYLTHLHDYIWMPGRIGKITPNWRLLLSLQPYNKRRFQTLLQNNFGIDNHGRNKLNTVPQDIMSWRNFSHGLPQYWGKCYYFQQLFENVAKVARIASLGHTLHFHPVTTQIPVLQSGRWGHSHSSVSTFTGFSAAERLSLHNSIQTAAESLFLAG